VIFLQSTESEAKTQTQHLSEPWKGDPLNQEYMPLEVYASPSSSTGSKTSWGPEQKLPSKRGQKIWGNTKQTSYAPNFTPISEIPACKLHDAAMPCIHRQQENNLGTKEQCPMHSEPRVVISTT
jgi:hypothetical protein